MPLYGCKTVLAKEIVCGHLVISQNCGVQICAFCCSSILMQASKYSLFIDKRANN